MASITFSWSGSTYQGGWGASQAKAKDNKKTLSISFDTSSIKDIASNIQINSAYLYLDCGNSGKDTPKVFYLKTGLSGEITSTGDARNGTCYLDLGSGYGLVDYLKGGGGTITSTDDSTTYHKTNSPSGYYTENYTSVYGARLVIDYAVLKSSLTNYPSSVEVGSSFSYTINSNATNYTHNLGIIINNSEIIMISQGITSGTYTYTAPAFWAQYFTSSQNATATFVLTTINGSENIGSNYYATNVSATELKPVVSSISVSTPISFQNYSCAFVNRTVISVNISGTAQQNASISTYHLLICDGERKPISYHTNATGSFSFIPAQAGNLVLQSYVADSRGNASATAEKVIYITNYVSPSLITEGTPFYRVNEAGEKTPQGLYYGFSYQSLNYTNEIVYLEDSGIRFSNEVSVSITIGETTASVSENPWRSTKTYPTDASFIATVKLIDTYGMETYYTYDAPSASYLLHFLNGQNSVGIGCAAEQIEEGEAGKIAMGWPLYANNNVSIEKNLVINGSLTLTQPLAISQGGTGASTAQGARDNLGITETLATVNNQISTNTTNLISLTTTVNTINSYPLIKKMLWGIIDWTDMPANTTTDVMITYETPFPYAPFVLTCFETNSTAGSFGRCTCAINPDGSNENQLTIRLFNGESSARRPRIRWIAMTI